MADEIVETPVVEDTESEGETPETKKVEKVFKQEDIDRAVKGRLASTKKEYADAKATWEERETDLTTQIQSYEAILQKTVDSLKADIPENFRGLFEKLSVLEQYEWLTNPKNKIAKKEIPSTPKQEGEGNKSSNQKIKKFL
jgi:hypothetical protein